MVDVTRTSLTDDLKLVISITNTGSNDMPGGFNIGVICEGFEYKQVTLAHPLPVFAEKQFHITLKSKPNEKYIGNIIHIYADEIIIGEAEFPLCKPANSILS